MPKLNRSYTNADLIAYVSVGTLHACGRCRRQPFQALPTEVNGARFEWEPLGDDLWSFHATLKGTAEGEFSDLEEAVFLACASAPCRVDRKMWEPDPEPVEAVLSNGGALRIEAGRVVEAVADDNLNDNPTGSTEAAVRSALGPVEFGPWSLNTAHQFVAAIVAA